MVAEYKNNHYVPEMLVRRFSDGNGSPFYYDKRRPENPIQRRNPRKIFCEDYLYVDVDKDGNRDVSLERDIYAKLENDAALIIDKIVEAAGKGKTPSLSQVEKSKWDEFLYQQWQRTPDALAKLGATFNFQEELEGSLAFFEKYGRPITPVEHAKFTDPSFLDRLKKSAFIGSLKGKSSQTQKALGSRGLGIVKISDSKKSFIVGSFPVVKLTFQGRTHLTDPSVEAWLPISHDVAVTPWGSNGDEKIVAIDGQATMQINQYICDQSNEIAGRSAELLHSLWPEARLPSK